MKIKHYQGTDTLYIELRSVEVAETRDLDENTLLDLDRDGKLIAREFGLQSRSVFVDHIKKALSQGQAVQAQK